MSMGRHRATGMDVRIDKRPKRFYAFQPRIEFESQLARQRQVRTLSRGGYDPINRSDASTPLARFSFDNDHALSVANRHSREACDEPYASALRQAPDFKAKLAARRELISVAAAVDAREIGAARRPNRRRPLLLARQTIKIDESVAR